MKTQDIKNNNNGQGGTTADRAFTNQNEKLKERGISNAGGQRSFQTSSKDSMHKPERRKPML
jgi:phage terminase large subunit